MIATYESDSLEIHEGIVEPKIAIIDRDCSWKFELLFCICTFVVSELL